MTRSQMVALSISILFFRGIVKAAAAEALSSAAGGGGMYTWVNTHKRGVKLVPLQQRRDAQESSSKQYTFYIL